MGDWQRFGSHAFVPAVVGAIAAAMAALGVVGADFQWLVPLGARVAAGHVPSSIPSAVAPTTGWHDVIAGGQLVVWAAYRILGGDRGLMALQVLGAAAGFGLLALGLRRQSTAGATLAVSELVLLGGATSILVARVSVFSLALFPLLLLLVHEDERNPGRQIWLAVPLLAIWSNLHGAVLVGLGVLAVYLVLGRARRSPGTAAAVLCASALAVCATPQLEWTPLYYRGVFENEAAARGAGLWAPLGLGPFDLAYIAVAVVLLVAAARGRMRAWELVVFAVLAAESVHTARIGLFALMVAAYPAARGLRVRAPRSPVVALAAAGCVAVAVAGVVLTKDGAAAGLAHRAAALGGVVLAEPLQAERVEVDGGRVFVANPIDAFRHSDQRLYLDWVAGRPAGRKAVERAQLVLVTATSPAGRAAAGDDRLRLLAAAGGDVLYRVHRP